MHERPRIGVIGYGSILNVEDLTDVLTNTEERMIPIRVDGFKRIFNQEASWRETAGDARAVLNVVREEDNWFNGVLIKDLSRNEFLKLRDRERGYRFVEVQSTDIDSYDSSQEEDVSDHELILVSTGEKVREDISPIKSYIDLCLEGAADWGGEFLTDFKRSTEMNSGVTLETYLERTVDESEPPSGA